MKPLRDLIGKAEEIKHFYTTSLLTNVTVLMLIDLIILGGNILFHIRSLILLEVRYFFSFYFFLFDIP